MSLAQLSAVNGWKGLPGYEIKLHSKTWDKHRQAYKIELGELLDHNENGNWGAEWKMNKTAFFQNNIVKISEQTVNISSTGHACHCDETWWNSVTAASCLASAAKGWKAQILLHQRIIWTNWWLCARMKSNEMGLMPVSFFNPSELSSRSQLKWQILSVYLYICGDNVIYIYIYILIMTIWSWSELYDIVNLCYYNIWNTYLRYEKH